MTKQEQKEVVASAITAYYNGEDRLSCTHTKHSIEWDLWQDAYDMEETKEQLTHDEYD